MLHAVQRRGHAADIVEALLDAGARDQSFFEREAELDGDGRGADDRRPATVSCVRDAEHNAWALAVDDRSLGYPRTDTISGALIASARIPGARRQLRRDSAPWPAALRRGGVDVRLAAGKADEPEEPTEADDGVRTPEPVASARELAALTPATAAPAPPARPAGQGRAGEARRRSTRSSSTSWRSAARASRSTATRASAR